MPHQYGDERLLPLLREDRWGNLILAIQELSKAIRGLAKAQGAAPTLAPVASPDAEPPPSLPYDEWSDDDYRDSEYEEILGRVMELRRDLADWQKYHGKKRGLETVDNAPTIAALEQEIKRAFAI